MFPLRDTIPSNKFPFITISIIIINLVIFFYEVSLGQNLEIFIQNFGVIPAKFTTFWKEDPTQIAGLVITPFSSIFLHGGWMHVISNMWYLWIFGDNIEDRTGHFRFFIFYIICGLIANATHIVTNVGSNIPTIGASGAVAGVMGAYFLLFPRSKITTLFFLVIFIQIVRIPALFFLGFWIVLQIISGTLSMGLDSQTGGVAWWAHIGGFFSGLLLILFFKKHQK